MAGEWHVTTFEKAPLQIIDGDRGKNYPKQTEFSPTGHCLFLNAGNVTTNGFRFDDCAFITTAKDAMLRKGKLVRNDVVLTTRGTVGNAAYFDDSVPFDHIRINSGMVILRALTPALQPRYLYLFVRSALFHEQVSALRTGSAQPQLPIQDINRVEVPIPSPDEQRAIANILGTMDDKIELNRRMNETLEAMAQALFRSWFVDFDPIRAKVEGRDAVLPQDLAGLFPDSFEDSELGEIPKGWEAGPLGHFFQIGLGGAWGEDQKSDRATVSVCCLRGIDCHELAEGRIPDVPVRWVSPKQAADRQLPIGTILIEGSGSFCGRSMIWKRAYRELFSGPIGYSNFCKRLDPVCSPSQAIICWMQIRQAYRDGVLQSFRTGTAFPNFDVHGALANLIVVVPPIPLADAYARIFEFSQRVDLMAQSQTLAALRDTLLPKLISGEIRVKRK